MQIKKTIFSFRLFCSLNGLRLLDLIRIITIYLSVFTTWSTLQELLATEWPMVHTIPDFWSMVYDHEEQQITHEGLSNGKHFSFQHYQIFSTIARVYQLYISMSKKTLPISYSKLLYKMGQDFLDTQYKACKSLCTNIGEIKIVVIETRIV